MYIYIYLVVKMWFITLISKSPFVLCMYPIYTWIVTMLVVKHLLSGILQVIPSNTKYSPFFGASKMNGSDRKSEDFCRKKSSYGESMDSDWWLSPTPS